MLRYMPSATRRDQRSPTGSPTGSPGLLVWLKRESCQKREKRQTREKREKRDKEGHAGGKPPPTPRAARPGRGYARR